MPDMVRAPRTLKGLKTTEKTLRLRLRLHLHLHLCPLVPLLCPLVPLLCPLVPPLQQPWLDWIP